MNGEKRLYPDRCTIWFSDGRDLFPGTVCRCIRDHQIPDDDLAFSRLYQNISGRCRSGPDVQLGRDCLGNLAAPSDRTNRGLYCAVSSIGLALVLGLLGWSSIRIRNWADRVAASGSQVWVNNILIIALAVHINQPLAATLSVFYLIPLYGFVVFFSVLANRVETASIIA